MSKPDPHESALANPKSRVKAIRAKCWDCQGRGADPCWQRAVRECTVQICPLWHVRPGSSKASESINSGREQRPNQRGSRRLRIGLGRPWSMQ